MCGVLHGQHQHVCHDMIQQLLLLGSKYLPLNSAASPLHTLHPCPLHQRIRRVTPLPSPIDVPRFLLIHGQSSEHSGLKAREGSDIRQHGAALHPLQDCHGASDGVLTQDAKPHGRFSNTHRLPRLPQLSTRMDPAAWRHKPRTSAGKRAQLSCPQRVVASRPQPQFAIGGRRCRSYGCVPSTWCAARFAAPKHFTCRVGQAFCVTLP